MPRFAANISLMYAEFAPLDRFSAAARDGFDIVEFLFPYEFGASDIAQRLADNGQTQILLNAPPGQFALGERGIACLPDRQHEFRRTFSEQALTYAAALGCPQIHVMAGVRPDMSATESRHDAAHEIYLSNLQWAAKEAASAGIDVLIEPINRRDFPGYFLYTQQQAHDIVRAVGAPNLKVQMDLYHCQVSEGDLAMKLRRYLPGGLVGHMQIAGVPSRHEPDMGEVNYPYLFDLIDELGYAGVVSCEYRPAAGTSEGLGWLETYRLRPRLAASPEP